MRNRIPAEIIDRASEWFVEMREPSVELAQRESFSAWLRQSPVHVQAYLEIASLWSDTEQIDPSRDFGIDEALHSGAQSPNVVPFMPADADRVGGASAPGEAESPLAHMRLKAAGTSTDDTKSMPSSAAPASVTLRTPLKRLSDWRIAASVLLILGALAASWWQLARAPVHTADIGEQRMITLDDGSIVRLNSRSQVRVELTSTLRSVQLMAGQAHFEVAKDTSRPFVVRSGDASIRAVGTAFDVYRRIDIGTVVTVVEGQVVVNSRGTSAPAADPGAGRAADSGPASEVTPVSAGEQVVVTRTGTIERRDANIAAATSWLRHEMIFSGEPLSVVAEEFNRYTRRTIVIDDPSLAELRINAVFHSTNPESLLKFVRRFEGVVVSEEPSQIRISRRAPT